MHNFKSFLLPFLCLFIAGCTSEPPSGSDAEVVELDDFETIIQIDDGVLSTPNIIRYEDSSFFVYDAAQGMVLELDNDGAIVKEYGRQGRGPGELLTVNNLYLTVEHLYIVDPWQFMIHKYERGRDFIESMNYVSRTSQPNAPPAPISSTTILASDFDNQPFVTLSGDVMLSAVQFEDTVETIYELRAWNGDKRSGIGEVPEGSSFLIDNEQMKSDVTDRVIPSLYRPKAFPVNDPANPEEYFLVYSAFPRIAKYNSSGQKLWEKEVRVVAETDEYKAAFFEQMERLQQNDIRNRIPLQHYKAGISSAEGDLFLISEFQDLWIHQFNPAGDLIRRYKLISDEDVKLKPIFDIDFSGRRVFVVTEEAEVRAYTF
ncbi:MAG: 6-bladed beta-propeller [Balneolaceae bacterium]